MYNESTAAKLRQLRIQIKAVRLARLEHQGPVHVLEELDSEWKRLKHEYRYLTFEENHGSLAAEMVVGEVPK